MKRIILNLPRVEELITVDALLNHSLIGMEANSHKYVLTAASDGQAVFVSSCGNHWSSSPSRKSLLEEVVRDQRCRMFSFNTSKELGAWLVA